MSPPSGCGRETQRLSLDPQPRSFSFPGKRARVAPDGHELVVRHVPVYVLRNTLYEEDHTDVASGLTYLAQARYEQGDHLAADTLLRKALPIFRRAFGDDSPDVADVFEHLGAVRLAEGDLAAADSLFARALGIWRGKSIERTHDRPATLMLRIGELRLIEGELDSARSWVREALTLRQVSLPDGHWQIAEARSLLGACLSALGRYDEAEPLLIEGHAGISAIRGEHDRLARGAFERLMEHGARKRDSG